MVDHEILSIVKQRIREEVLAMDRAGITDDDNTKQWCDSNGVDVDDVKQFFETEVWSAMLSGLTEISMPTWMFIGFQYGLIAARMERADG